MGFRPLWPAGSIRAEFFPCCASAWRFSHPVGLAAGFHKILAIYLDALGALGFRPCRVGTVTRVRKAGQSQSRVCSGFPEVSP